MSFFFLNSLQPQLFGNCSEQSTVETGEKDWQTCAVVNLKRVVLQYGFNSMLKLKKTFSIMGGLGKLQ